MKSRLFEITHNPETGCITSVVLAGDSCKMNWVCCDDGYEWGGIDTSTRTHSEFHRKNDSEPVLLSFSEDDNFAEAVYENKRLRVTVSRRFTGAGNLRERAAIKNIAHMPYTVCRDNFSLAFPFNDRYTYADDCMTNRCNTHIRCGGNVSYVNALRMGASELNLGMVLTEAFAAGTPVIASRVGGLTFTVRDGETGYLVPEKDPKALAEKLELVLTDRALRERLGNRAVRVARTYGWENVADEIEDLYAELGVVPTSN